MIQCNLLFDSKTVSFCVVGANTDVTCDAGFFTFTYRLATYLA